MNGVPTALTDQAGPAAGQVCCDLLACCLCLALQHQLPYRLAMRHGTSPLSIDRAGSERVDAGFAGAVEEVAYDKPNRHSQQSQLRRLSGRPRRGPWALNRPPVAPPWRRGRSLEKAAKKWGSPFWASSDERVECEAGHPGPDSPSTHLRSPGAHPRSG